MIELVTPQLRSYNFEFHERLNRQYSIKFIFTRNGGPKEFSGMKVPESWDYENINLVHINSLHACDAKNWLRLTLTLLRDDYEVIVASPAETTYSLLALLISKLRFKKIIFRSDNWYWPSNKVLLKFYFYVLIKWMVERSDAVLAVGEKQYAFFANTVKKRNIVFYMPPYVVPYEKRDVAKLLEKLAAEDPRISGKKIILYMSQIIRRKGLDYLIRAFKILENELDDVYLLIVGSGEFEVYCKELAINLGVRNIMFKGYVEDSEIELYHNVCDVLVLPSILDDYPEPDGYVVYESMSVGKPLVVTDAVGASQMVRNGINGFVVKNRNTSEIADALGKILTNEKTRREMGNKSKEIFKEKISLEKQIEAFKQAIAFVQSRESVQKNSR